MINVVHVPIFCQDCRQVCEHVVDSSSVECEACGLVRSADPSLLAVAVLVSGGAR